jgi:hypothetical protein
MSVSPAGYYAWRGRPESPRKAAKARRWLMRDAEIKAHDADLDALTASCAPIMLEAHEISTGTAAEMLILAGDNPEWENEPASPQPGRQPAGQCRPVSWRDRPNAKPPADSRLRQETQSRWQRQNGDHPLSQALRRP